MDDRREGAVPAVRVSDRDRDEVLAVLAAALAEGRLAPYEHASRAEQALRARTADELAPLVADLPEPAPSRAERDRKDLKDWLAEWRYWLGGALIMSAIWGARCAQEGQLTYYWPVAPLGVWAAVLVAVAVLPREAEDADD
ncbi:DUF1707 SHOCT-like domain-containing protein [Streptomyces neyagawaensis]|uniref:DUF1707 SHOCT-like domain-containing protein n=1 Tax=Streptomyces neyagawaensis TaxID=42238 RepID=UPI0006E3C998|nr:DUF1707 domain-containing protein [Streptomyces neyagawaensis]MCL6736115.1 DUF1707 domain-containing protein [Streptomyces neyagawaensis]MDE1688948.1 DUF1707 domain-containing protein [Streptomyces neyagawaensis]